MGTINVMDTTGHSSFKWDKKVAESVDHAREMFKALTAKGFAIFRKSKKGEPGEKIKEFDPNAEELIAVPHMQGG